MFLLAAVHFPRNAAGGRALRLFSCRGSISCKEIGEVHVRRPAKRPFRRALPPFSCRRPCTSPVSLHEFPPLQGFGGSARHHARKAGKCTTTHSKCTSSCTDCGGAHTLHPKLALHPKCAGMRKNSRKRIPSQEVCNSTRLSEYKRLPEGIMSENDNNGGGWL